jgi:hypothetical protein
MDSNYYGVNANHKFAFVKDYQTFKYLLSAHNAITTCELWNWMRVWEPPCGFMFDQSAEMGLIREQMEKDEINASHSGASYSGIMREMLYIAKYGYTQYACKYVVVVA